MQINETKAAELEKINRIKYTSVRLEEIKEGDVFSYRGKLWQATGNPYRAKVDTMDTWAVDAVEFQF